MIAWDETEAAILKRHYERQANNRAWATGYDQGFSDGWKAAEEYWKIKKTRGHNAETT